MLARTWLWKIQKFLKISTQWTITTICNTVTNHERQFQVTAKKAPNLLLILKEKKVLLHNAKLVPVCLSNYLRYQVINIQQTKCGSASKITTFYMCSVHFKSVRIYAGSTQSMPHIHKHLDNDVTEVGWCDGANYEMENDWTSHNFILFAIFALLIIKVGENFTGFWRKWFCTWDMTQNRNSLSKVRDVQSVHSIVGVDRHVADSPPSAHGSYAPDVLPHATFLQYVSCNLSSPQPISLRTTYNHHAVIMGTVIYGRFLDLSWPVKLMSTDTFA